MKKITTSIETCIRYFENNIKRNDFLTFQVRLEKPIPVKQALFEVLSTFNEKQQIILAQQFKISKNHITFFNSHEDPVVQDEKYIFLSLHIPKEILPSQFDMLSIRVEGLGCLDFTHQFNELSSNNLSTPLSSTIDVNAGTIHSQLDTNLTLHLGSRDGEYTEEYFTLRKNEVFSFQEYIYKYPYIGVQCSYEQKNPETEEKHIIKGQKGIYETGLLKDQDGAIIAQGLLPFNHRFLNSFKSYSSDCDGFIEVSSVAEVVKYHEQHPIRFFESSLNFLEPEYKTKNTYSQSKLYSSVKKRPGCHLTLAVCSSCQHNTECVQVVPSGLSGELMRQNLMMENVENCQIYQLIKQKKA